MAKDILRLVEEREAQAECARRRGLIISPGAIGDCLLLLPLAEFMKESLQLGGIDFIGHASYVDYFPGRTCVDGVRSIDSIEFHRLFTDSKEFVVKERDSLVSSFARYEWIVSFMGAGHSDFESNLIFAAHCSHSAEVCVLPVVSLPDFSDHISDFYIQEFIKAGSLECESWKVNKSEILVHPHESDVLCGRKLLESTGIEPSKETVVIHPGSGGQEKNWHLDNFCRVAESLNKRGVQVVFLLGPAEQERFDNNATESMSATGGKCISGLDLTQISQIVTCSDLFLGNDSGITHLAAGMGARTVVVFGPTDPVLYKPLGPSVRVFAADTDSFSRPSVESREKVRKIVFEMLEC